MVKSDNARIMNRAFIFFTMAVSAFFRSFGWRACRFHPSCSTYTREAYQTRSFFEASWISIKRILRCHPFSAGGYDPLTHSTAKKDS